MGTIERNVSNLHDQDTGEMVGYVNPVTGKPMPGLNNAQVVGLGTGKIVMTDGSVATLVEATPYVTRTTTGTAFSGPCELAGWDCTVAAGTITIYDNTAASGTVIVPATALTLGRTEFTWKRALTTGCHVVLSGAATVNVLVG